MYHNPKCSKSRATLELLNSKSIEPKIIEYLSTPLTPEELIVVFKALGKKPKEVLRTKEDDFKKLNIDLENDSEVISAVINFPKILERPIVLNGDRGVIGRPPENIMELL